MFMPDEPQQMGAWYNNWGDLWGDLKSIGGAITQSGGSSQGFSTTGSPGGTGWNGVALVYTQQAFYDDLAIIQAWKDAVIATGGVVTRMGPGPYEGELAERSSGPGTDFPNAPQPYTITLAPANVRAADKRATAAQPPAVDAIVPRAQDPGPGGSWPSIDWKKYALIAAVVVGGVLILPPLLSAATASSARRR